MTLLILILFVIIPIGLGTMMFYNHKRDTFREEYIIPPITEFDDGYIDYGDSEYINQEIERRRCAKR